MVRIYSQDTKNMSNRQVDDDDVEDFLISLYIRDGLATAKTQAAKNSSYREELSQHFK